MQFRFTYVIDDVREAVRTAYRPVRSHRGRRWLASIMLFVSVAVITFVSLRTPAPGRPRPDETTVFDLRVILVPSLLPVLEIVLWVTWAAIKQMRLRPAVSRDPDGQPGITTRKAAVEAKVVGACLGTLPALAIFWLAIPGPQIRARMSGSDLAQMSINLLIAQMVLLWSAIWVYRRLQVRSQWDAKPSWRREKVMTLDANGLTLGDSHAREELRWAYFTRVRETEHLLVFHREDGMMQLLPKRAIPEAELEHVRSLIGNNVPAKFMIKPGGFSVVPVAPIPVQPIEQ